jgi:hypothetical protein
MALSYYRRIFRAYLWPRASQLSFWHDRAELNPNAPTHALGEYHMTFGEKALYIGPHDGQGIPLLNYHGAVGLQYNPIAIAQWGLGNYNLFSRSGPRKIPEGQRLAMRTIGTELPRFACMEPLF